MSDTFLGEIRMFAGNFAAKGWAFCNGQLMPIAVNSAVFSLLSTGYGGDGVCTFALPNLGGRVPVGTGQSLGLLPVTLGEQAEVENVTILTAQMPEHTHGLTTTATVTSVGSLQVVGTASNASTTPQASNNILGASTVGGAAAVWADQLTDPPTFSNPETINITLNVNVTLQTAGGSQQLPILNPYPGINFLNRCKKHYEYAG